MTQFWEKKLVAMKMETVYGTDTVPTGAANAILARNFTFDDPDGATSLDRNLVKPTLGNSGQPQALRRCVFGFDIKMAGAGAAGTAPKYGPCLRACGMAETINAGVSVVYLPASSAYESASSYFFIDGTRHKFTGVRGSLAVVIPANDIPVFRVKYTGIYNDPSAVALPAADFTGFQDPEEISKDNTPTFTIDGFAAVVRELNIDLNQTVDFRDLINVKDVQITNRQPNGSLTVEAPALGTKDFFALARAETRVALQLIHGVGAGKIVQLDQAKVQLKKPRYSNVNGIAYLAMDLNPTPNAGDDDLMITVK